MQVSCSLLTFSLTMLSRKQIHRSKKLWSVQRTPNLPTAINWNSGTGVSSYVCVFFFTGLLMARGRVSHAFYEKCGRLLPSLVQNVPHSHHENTDCFFMPNSKTMILIFCRYLKFVALVLDLLGPWLNTYVLLSVYCFCLYRLSFYL